VGIHLERETRIERLGADDGDPTTTAPVYELTLVYEGQPTTLLKVIADALGVSSVSRADLRFGRDLQGQLYVMTKQDGWLRALTPLPEPKLAVGLIAGTRALLAAARARRTGPPFLTPTQSFHDTRRRAADTGLPARGQGDVRSSCPATRSDSM
jgi:hypothetical protein